MALEDYPFRVEKMGPRGEIGQVLCYTDNLSIARTAFEAAQKQYPKDGMRLPRADHRGTQAALGELE